MFDFIAQLPTVTVFLFHIATLLVIMTSLGAAVANVIVAWDGDLPTWEDIVEEVVDADADLPEDFVEGVLLNPGQEHPCGMLWRRWQVLSWERPGSQRRGVVVDDPRKLPMLA